MHSHFISYLGMCSTEEDQIHNGATLHVVYPKLSIPCLLMTWRLKEPGHQQAWYWPSKPEYSISSIRRDNHNHFSTWLQLGPGDLRSQGISRHGIDQISQNIPPLASEEVIILYFLLDCRWAFLTSLPYLRSVRSMETSSWASQKTSWHQTLIWPMGSWDIGKCGAVGGRKSDINMTNGIMRYR